MAVRINGTGVNLVRTASLPDIATFTVCGWAKLGTERNWYALFSLDDADTNFLQLALDETSPTRALTYSSSKSGAGAAFASRPSNGVWFFWAITHAPAAVGNYFWGYWALEGASSFVTLNRDETGDFTPTGMYVGNDGYNDYGDAAYSNIKIWDGVVLTAAELWQEMHTIRPQRSANLHLWTPLFAHTDLADYSGNGRGWTGTGTLTTEDGPPVGYGAVPWVVQFAAASGGSQTINANAIASAETVYQPALTMGAITINANAIASAEVIYQPAVSQSGGTQTINANAIASAEQVYAPAVQPGAVTISPNAIASTSTVYAPAVSVGSVTISVNAIASTSTVYAPAVTVGSITISVNAIASTATVRPPELLANATINGVLTVDATNARYFANDAGPLVLAGFHTWYDVQDGGASDPPSAFDWDAYLAALVSYGCNFTKLWLLETARDWPDVAGQYYAPHPWARTGPGNAADGKPKFDLTTWDEDYFTRLRSRAIEAGNAGLYVCVQLFQGWHIQMKGFSAGDPWGYHPFENGNNINSIDGDTDNDGEGEETRDASNTAIYNLQKAYVEKVIDTVNDLDNVIFEVSNEDTYSATALSWQRAIAAYIKSYEAGKAKQHSVGITKLWPGGSNANLFGSDDADWISIDDDYPTPTPDVSDGSKVVLWDTDHVMGLTDQYQWVLQSFCGGNNPIYMDEWDGALYGTDRRASSAYILIRRLLGDALGYANRIDLAHATPQGALSSTGWCLAKTTGSAQLFAYQDNTGNFTVNLTALSGVFALEWYRVSDGSTQAGSDVNGGAVRTLTPPWSGAVAAFLTQAALLIDANAIDSTATVYAPTLTMGAITVSPNAIASTETVHAPAVTMGALTINVTAIASSETVYAPALIAYLTVSLETIASSETVYAPEVQPGAITISPQPIGSTSVVYAPDVTSGMVVQVNTIASTSTVYAPSLTMGAIVVEPEPIASTAQVYAPAVQPGAITVSVNAIDSTAQVYAPAVTVGGLTISPDAIASAEVVYAPTLTFGAITVEVNAIESAAVVYEPTVQTGVIVISPEAIASTATVYAPAVAHGALTIQVDAIASSAVVHAPALSFGAITIELETVASGAVVYAPEVLRAAELTIRPETVASTAQVYAPLIALIVATAARTYRVPVEPRTGTVAAESRTHVVN